MFNKSLMILFLLVLTVSIQITFGDFGWWDSTGDHRWENPENWSLKEVPILLIDDGNVIINNKSIYPAIGVYISPGVIAEANRIQFSTRAGETGTLSVTGGTLNGYGQLRLGVNVQGIGILNLSRGLIDNSASSTFVGFFGTGLLNITGGTFNTNYLTICQNNGSTGHIQLDGGVISTQVLALNYDRGNASFDITGGALILVGNKIATMQGWFDDGYFTAYGGTGVLDISYDNSTNQTTVKAIQQFDYACHPYPQDDQDDVSGEVVLKWISPQDSISCDVYLGTNFNEVNEAESALPIAASVYKGRFPENINYYDPCQLELGQDYYWRIDLVNEPDICTGKVWSFHVADHNYYVVDDFESYSDTSELSQCWQSDGSAEVNLEKFINHQGYQSIVITYNTGVSPFYSEIQHDFQTAQDWTKDGIAALTLFFHGSFCNDIQKLYVNLQDYNNIPNAGTIIYPYSNDLNYDYWETWLTAPEKWRCWNIDLDTFKNKGVDLTNVKKVSIGIEKNSGLDGSGIIFLDDIRLYPSRCISTYSSYTDLSNDCMVDIFDFSLIASEWLSTQEVRYDLYKDSNVNFRDFVEMAEDWNKSFDFYGAEGSFSVVTTEDIVFKSVGEIDLSLIIDYPSGGGTYPVIFYVAGGGWINTDIENYADRSKYLASKGIAGVRISYRVISQGGTFDGCMDDIMDAVTFIRKNSEAYKLDLSRICFIAGSAGTPLAAMAAQNIPECKCFVGFNGIYDFINNQQGTFPTEQQMLDFFGDISEQRLKEVSAIFNLRLSPPSSLLLHGTADTVINYQQSISFAEAVETAGGSAEAKIYNGAEHGFFNTIEYEETTTKEVESFLKKYLN